MADLEPLLPQVAKGRNFARGKEAYEAAQCTACHKFGNDGGAIGPDLTAVSSRFNRSDILESIIEPSKVVSEQYQNTIVRPEGRRHGRGPHRRRDAGQAWSSAPNPLTARHAVTVKKRGHQVPRPVQAVADARGLGQHAEEGRDPRPDRLHRIRRPPGPPGFQEVAGEDELRFKKPMLRTGPGCRVGRRAARLSFTAGAGSAMPPG